MVSMDLFPKDSNSPPHSPNFPDTISLKTVTMINNHIIFDESQHSYIFANKIGHRGSVRVPQRDMGIVVQPVSRFFVLYSITLWNMEHALEKVAIESLIYEVRGQKVMLDRDLARLYGVETKVLNQAVKRNRKRFPEDFMFQMTYDECLRSQIVTLNTKQGHHLKYMPHVFTEQGVAMLSSVLKSDTAIEVNIRIMRTFVSIRHQLSATQHLSIELEAIKAKLELLERNDEDNLEAINDLSEDMRQEIDTIYQAIAALSIKEPNKAEPPLPKIGFKTSQSEI